MWERMKLKLLSVARLPRMKTIFISFTGCSTRYAGHINICFGRLSSDDATHHQKMTASHVGRCERLVPIYPYCGH
jgi:hypothetical protein